MSSATLLLLCFLSEAVSVETRGTTGGAVRPNQFWVNSLSHCLNELDIHLDSAFLKHLNVIILIATRPRGKNPVTGEL